MVSKDLSIRAPWQGKANASGGSAEDIFHTIMDMYLEGTNIKTINKPDSLRGIYGTRKKGSRVSRHGIIPEYMFYNSDTEKSLFVEIKKQGNAGNAHERACKYFAPGIVRSMREVSNQEAPIMPMWWVFTGGLVHDKYRRQEIEHWFYGYLSHLTFWADVRDRSPIITHFDNHIRDLLL